jgi:hypothetical protein
MKEKYSILAGAIAKITGNTPKYYFHVCPPTVLAYKKTDFGASQMPPPGLPSRSIL